MSPPGASVGAPSRVPRAWQAGARSSRAYRGSRGAARPRTAFVLSGVAFAHAMRAFRWVRAHYDALRYGSGAVLVALGLLLFFHRDWWLRIALDQLLSKVGLGTY